MDSVSRIHRRFSLTLINPSSYRTSLIISLACIGIIAYIVDADPLIIPVTLGVALLLFRLDHLLLRHSPVAKPSKVYHTNAFASMLWLAILIISVLLSMLGAHDTLIIEGMIFAVGLRACIFTSVFGASLRRSLLIAPIMPFTVLLLLMHYEGIVQMLDTPTIASSVAIMGIVIAWCILADRSGRPGVESTFRLLQAYLLAWTERDARLMESMMESRAELSTITTRIIAFKRESDRSASGSWRYDTIILPDLHPGPFYPVGGSNLPYDIHARYSTTAAVMHGISDHSSNLPSRREVERFLDALAHQTRVEEGFTCTEPITINTNDARVTGMAFGRVALLLLSSSRGMDDIPRSVKDKVEHHASEHGFRDVLIIDTHNCMGDDLSDEEINDMVDACKRTLNALTGMKQYRFRIGVARAEHDGGDMGPAGMSAIAVLPDGADGMDAGLVIAWVDANNAVKGLSMYVEQAIREQLAPSIVHAVLCTSDTHYTSGRARNRMGYFPLGSVTSRDTLTSMLIGLSRSAVDSASHAWYELRVSSATVRIMGDDQFRDYSHALDRAMSVTKMSISASVLVFIAMMISTFI
ncbi:MAG: DUF2070 family protein [Candidatus Nitrosocaldus sp.]|nr:DUF2070 family protein [Candidatus Nitrosocaldus sp.]MDW8275569.1 DUF2070 family protein [Candidatus Nitrosocaldus sp.]